MYTSTPKVTSVIWGFALCTHVPAERCGAFVCSFSLERFLFCYKNIWLGLHGQRRRSTVSIVHHVAVEIPPQKEFYIYKTLFLGRFRCAPAFCLPPPYSHHAYIGVCGERDVRAEAHRVTRVCGRRSKVVRVVPVSIYPLLQSATRRSARKILKWCGTSGNVWYR